MNKPKTRTEEDAAKKAAFAAGYDCADNGGTDEDMPEHIRADIYLRLQFEAGIAASDSDSR